MSECKINLVIYHQHSPSHGPCDRCGEGPCHIWRDEKPSAVEPDSDPDSKDADSQKAPTDARPDPAYAAALSETSILVDARARSFDLAVKLAAQSEDAAEIDFPRLLNISNRILKYLLDGK